MSAVTVHTAAGVILAALTQNRTAAGIADALDSAGLLMSPAKANRFEQLQRENEHLRNAGERQHTGKLAALRTADRYRTAWHSARRRARKQPGEARPEIASEEVDG
ncbi:hypothetical protein [Streptomyces sp. NPDC002564]|uniref:hypothetical protein n=1 Tax=Streptomyces sp. NPDC002564 TaxID=3364649 RepID=UPI003688A254